MKRGMRVEFKMTRSGDETFKGKITGDRGCGVKDQIWIYVPKFKHQVCLNKNLVTKVIFD